MEKQILSFNDLPSALSLVINKLEILEDTTYSIDQKKMLYIHMCVMVERLILEKGRLPQEDMTDDLKCRESFIKNLKESFSVIENKYNVSLNERDDLLSDRK
jgi:sigma-54 dependent transcriptional regulator of gfr operon